ncbi:MAG: hypothetical protein H6618_07020 [Deltaproteobacteria bacterium]|nr:hypothetical protein [Deltaproteobacteria bacterium]
MSIVTTGNPKPAAIKIQKIYPASSGLSSDSGAYDAAGLPDMSLAREPRLSRLKTDATIGRQEGRKARTLTDKMKQGVRLVGSYLRELKHYQKEAEKPALRTHSRAAYSEDAFRLRNQINRAFQSGFQDYLTWQGHYGFHNLADPDSEIDHTEDHRPGDIRMAFSPISIRLGPLLAQVQGELDELDLHDQQSSGQSAEHLESLEQLQHNIAYLVAQTDQEITHIENNYQNQLSRSAEAFIRFREAESIASRVSSMDTFRSYRP